MNTFLRFSQNKNNKVKDPFAKLLRLRKEVITYLNILAQTHPMVDNSKITPSKFKTNLDKLCTLMVDYISLGHFGMDTALSTNNGSNRNSLGEKKQNSNAAILAKIHTIKDFVLNWVDKYEDFINNKNDNSVDINSDSFKQDLEEAFRALDVRFYAEDKIINRRRIKEIVRELKSKEKKDSKKGRKLER